MTGNCVLDASALVLALVGKVDGAEDLRLRLPTLHCHAPHLIDAEVGNVLRRHEQAGLIDTTEAATALRASESMIEYRYAHTGSLARHAWKWRANLTFYDALYVALAARLGVPLLTADARLAHVPGLDCQIELI